MAKAPLYTVINTSDKPQLVKFAGRSEPIDVGRDKVLPLTEKDALRLDGDHLKVLRPDGLHVRTPKDEPRQDDDKAPAKSPAKAVEKAV